jgi:glycosyltransferase involved in cell wall biosynthesis
MEMYKVLLFSRWYPGILSPLIGVFVKNQVDLMIQFEPQLTMGVGLYGQNDFVLQWRSLMLNVVRLRKYCQHIGLPHFFFKTPRLIYLYRPVLTWNPIFLNGNLARVQQIIYQQAIDFRRIVKGLDLIHVHSSAAAAPALKVAKALKVPLLITEHDLWIDQTLHPLLQQADGVIAVGQIQAEYLRSLGVRQVSVIPNMVDPERFLLREKPPEGPLVFATLARLDHRKGIAELLHAFAVLCQQSTVDMSLHIGGEGPCEQQFKGLAKALGIASKVFWAGGVPPNDVPQFLHRAHVFVLASQVESFGLVLAEALACGIPVIATRCGGPEDFIDTDNGILIDRNDERQLLEALLEMQRKHRFYEPQRLRRKIMAYCSPEQVTSQITAVYAQLVAAHTSL